jgi:hypothetical protein
MKLEEKMSRKWIYSLVFLILAILACNFGNRDTGSGDSGSFNPSGNTSLEGGTYSYTEFNIPAGVTVALNGSVVINVAGPTHIAGSIVGDCRSLEIHSAESLVLDGTIDTRCTNQDDQGGDVSLVVTGAMTLGSPPVDGSAIISGGDIILSDGEIDDLDYPPIVPEANQPTLIRISREFGSTADNGAAAQWVINDNLDTQTGGHIRALKREPGDIVVAANLTADSGNNAPAVTQAGNCDNSNGKGGGGGSVRLVARNGDLTIKSGVRLEAGDGGAGGNCTAPSGCKAIAQAGRGGHGGSVLISGANVTIESGVVFKIGDGGVGGDASAIGDDGAACTDGCDADAYAGDGGDGGGSGFLITEPGSMVGVPTLEGGNGGQGGHATASSGKGGDCDTCPDGDGGNAGDAYAFGGGGGDGTAAKVGSWNLAPDSMKQGHGGSAQANGNHGGIGATCCAPPKDDDGGEGGEGGDATARGGLPGEKGLGGGGVQGPVNVPPSMAGDGGDGGDGDAPGEPGTGNKEGTGEGEPIDIPDGEKGVDGKLCPKKTPEDAAHAPAQDKYTSVIDAADIENPLPVVGQGNCGAVAKHDQISICPGLTQGILASFIQPSFGRASPSTELDAVGNFNAGDQVTIVGKDPTGQWFLVKVDNPEKTRWTENWVHRDSLELPEGADLSTIPVVEVTVINKPEPEPVETEEPDDGEGENCDDWADMDWCWCPVDEVYRSLPDFEHQITPDEIEEQCPDLEDDFESFPNCE